MHPAPGGRQQSGVLRLELRQARAQQLEHALHSARGARRHRLALGVPHHKAQAPEHLRQ